MRSWLRVIAGVTVLVATASACQGESARPARPPKLTVAELGPKAAGGVIAKGTVSGKPWRIRLTLADRRSCDPRPGWWADCLEGVGHVTLRPRDWRDPAHVWTFSPALFGPVKPDVTSITMRFSDGTVARLHPVEDFGYRWIGIVIPPALTPVDAIAYAGHKEVGHAVPYVGPAPDAGPAPEIWFLSWLPQGVPGPPRRTKIVRGGGVTLVLRSGPWGNVLANQSASWEFPLGYRVSGALDGGGRLPLPVTVAFPSPARYVQLTFVNGTTKRVPLVLGAGLGFAIVMVPARPLVQHWDAYDAVGQRLFSGQGPPGGPYS